jgi:hypothetical protein
LDSCATACSSCTTELLRSSFSRSASARRATRSSSRLSKARDSWPNSSSPPSSERGVEVAVGDRGHGVLHLRDRARDRAQQRDRRSAGRGPAGRRRCPPTRRTPCRAAR